jgi:hypothetical protein
MQYTALPFACESTHEQKCYPCDTMQPLVTKNVIYQMQSMENSSTNGKDATPSDMETQNANKWRMQWKANA